MEENLAWLEIRNALEVGDYVLADQLLLETPEDGSGELLAFQVRVDFALSRYAEVLERTDGLEPSESPEEQEALRQRAWSLFAIGRPDEAFALLYGLMVVADAVVADFVLADIAWYTSRIKSKKAAILNLRQNESYVGGMSALIWALLLVEIGWYKVARSCLEQLRGRFDESQSGELEFADALISYNLHPKDEEAQRLLNASISVQKWSAAPYILEAANSFINHGHIAEGETISHLCREMMPDWREPRSNIVAANIMQGRFREAWQLFRAR